MQIVPIAEVPEIPDSTFIPCPMHRFAQKRVKYHCPGCAHFAGFVDTGLDGGDAFTARYRVNCAHPIARRMTVVDWA